MRQVTGERVTVERVRQSDTREGVRVNQRVRKKVTQVDDLFIQIICVCVFRSLSLRMLGTRRGFPSTAGRDRKSSMETGETITPLAFNGLRPKSHSTAEISCVFRTIPQWYRSLCVCVCACAL